MKSGWIVAEKQMLIVYPIYRLKDDRGPDEPENREYAAEYYDTREAAEEECRERGGIALFPRRRDVPPEETCAGRLALRSAKGGV